MIKSYYSVPIVRRDLLPLWYEAWDGNMPFGREASKDRFLRQTRIIKADNKVEAAMLAETKNPDHVVIRDLL